MIITKLHDQSFEISDICKGYLRRKVYYGYTIKEAKRDFKLYLKYILKGE